MITIFAIPKPFKGHFGTIQQNAITSWTLLDLKPEVILFGNEEGTKDLCKKLNIHHIPELAYNENNAPLLNDLFDRAKIATSNNLLCYVNSDIILMNDFTRVIQTLTPLKQKFLMVGRRWNVYIDNLLDFSVRNWQNELSDYISRNGSQASLPGNSDYFVFTKDLWGNIPRFAIGRGYWDSWLVYEALRLHADVIDASQTVMAVHQNHDQSFYLHGLRQWKKEINQNQKLAGKHGGKFTLLDVTHQLTQEGIHHSFGFRYFIHYLYNLAIFYPFLSIFLFLPNLLIKFFRSLKEYRTKLLSPEYELCRLIESKLPEDGVVSVVGLDKNQVNVNSKKSISGLLVAHSLLYGGHPVVIYDSNKLLMNEARQALSGTVKFASSLEECIKESDVVVVTSQEETKERIQEKLNDKFLINCCGVPLGEQLEGSLNYISWK